MKSVTSVTKVKRMIKSLRISTKTKTTSLKCIVLASLALTTIACEDDDPQVTPMAGTPAGSMTGGVIAGEMAGEMAGEVAGEMASCERPEADYPSDAWPMCISDDGVYELAGANTPSSAARVAAYELIGDLLWRNASPTPEDFIQAELIYAEDGGVGSRVTRRYDAHLSKTSFGLQLGSQSFRQLQRDQRDETNSMFVHVALI